MTESLTSEPYLILWSAPRREAVGERPWSDVLSPRNALFAPLDAAAGKGCWLCADASTPREEIDAVGAEMSARGFVTNIARRHPLLSPAAMIYLEGANLLWRIFSELDPVAACRAALTFQGEAAFTAQDFDRLLSGSPLYQEFRDWGGESDILFTRRSPHELGARPVTAILAAGLSLFGPPATGGYGAPSESGART